MPALLDTIAQQLSGETVRMLSRQIGADEHATRKAVASALPLLIGGLARSSNESHATASALTKVLARDHDGALLDNLQDLLQRSAGGGSLADAGGDGAYGIDRRSADGAGILRHVLGAKRSAVELGISKATGLDVKLVAQLLPLLAPVVMSALGKLHRQQKLDADGVARLLNRERAEVERGVPEFRRGGLMDYLDPDDEGEVAQVVAHLGAKLGADELIGRLLGR